MQNQDSDKSIHEEEDFATLFAAYLSDKQSHLRPQHGDLVQGIIVAISDKELVLDVGAKQDGIVPASDLAKLDSAARAKLEVGATIPAIVVNPHNLAGELILSIYLSQQEQDWLQTQAILESGAITEQEVVGYNRGGLTVTFGSIRGFVPASHLADYGRSSEAERVDRLSSYVGQMLPVKIIEVDRKKRRLVFSHRLAEQELREQRRASLLDELQAGQIVEGRVTAIRPFGVFVDIGGADGLIHLSELDWQIVKNPHDVVSVGENIRVMVLRLDDNRQRIALSRRRTLPNPWEMVAQRYHPGQIVPVRITKLMEFGAFAEIEPGIEGMIHLSELSHRPVRHPNEVVEVGQETPAQILRIESNRQRIALSLRRAATDWIAADDSHANQVGEYIFIENEYNDSLVDET